MILLQFPNREIVHERGKAVRADKPYLSTEEVAELLGFSVRTVTEWASQWHDSGGLEGVPAFKMGRSWRFDRQEINAYIARKKAPSQPIERKAVNA